MRFWEASAIVPLLSEEPRSRQLSVLLENDGEVAAWWGSRVECASAVRRRQRLGQLSPVLVGQALDVLEPLARSWLEVAPSEHLRVAAEHALAVHPLRAADALQLAAALTWRGSESTGTGFVCLDERLRDAASREGFTLLPESV